MAAHYFGTVENDTTGRPVSGALVYVRTAPVDEGGTLVTLYSDESVTQIDNPVTSDSYGYYSFYVADGHYTLEFAYNGTVRKTIPDVEIAESGAGDLGSLELRMDAAEIVTENATVIAFTGLADPGADRIAFWDESADTFDWLTVGTGFDLTDTTLTVDPVAAAGLTDPGADRIRFWDDSATAEAWLEVGSGLSLSGTTLSVTGITEASASEIWTGTETGKYVSPDKMFDAAAPQTLTSSSNSTAVDMATGINFNQTLDENTTLANPTNAKPGQSGRLLFTQDGTGGHTLAFAANWKLIGDAPTLTTTAGAKEVFAYFVNATDDIEYSYVGPKA